MDDTCAFSGHGFLQFEGYKYTKTKQKKTKTKQRKNGNFQIFVYFKNESCTSSIGPTNGALTKNLMPIHKITYEFLTMMMVEKTPRTIQLQITACVQQEFSVMTRVLDIHPLVIKSKLRHIQ